MITQKDIHNLIVKTFSMDSKISLIKSCGGDVDGIKEFEQKLADSFNNVWEMAKKAVEYMNTEV